MAKPVNIHLTRVSLDVLTELSDVQAGQLFKAIRLYQIAAHLNQSCVSVETIQSKTDWQDGNDLDLCLHNLASLIRNSFVRLAFTAVKSQLDEQLFPPHKEPAPTKSKEDLEAELKQRQQAFYDSLIPFLQTYDKKMIRAFYDYWSQPNKSGTKMSYELQKTWDLSKRLSMWASRDRQTIQPPLAEKGREIISTKNFEEF